MVLFITEIYLHNNLPPIWLIYTLLRFTFISSISKVYKLFYKLTGIVQC